MVEREFEAPNTTIYVFFFFWETLFLFNRLAFMITPFPRRHENVRKWKRNYHTVGIFPKSNAKFVERGKIDATNRQIHDRSLSWLGTVISIKNGAVKLVFLGQSPLFVKLKKTKCINRILTFWHRTKAVCIWLRNKNHQ